MAYRNGDEIGRVEMEPGHGGADREAENQSRHLITAASPRGSHVPHDEDAAPDGDRDDRDESQAPSHLLSHPPSHVLPVTPLILLTKLYTPIHSRIHKGGRGKDGSDPPETCRFPAPVGVPPSHLPGRVAPLRILPWLYGLLHLRKGFIHPGRVRSGAASLRVAGIALPPAEC